MSILATLALTAVTSHVGAQANPFDDAERSADTFGKLATGDSAAMQLTRRNAAAISAGFKRASVVGDLTKSPLSPQANYPLFQVQGSLSNASLHVRSLPAAAVPAWRTMCAAAVHALASTAYIPTGDFWVLECPDASPDLAVIKQRPQSRQTDPNLARAKEQGRVDSPAAAGSVVDRVIAHQFGAILGDQRPRAELLGIVSAIQYADAKYPPCQLNDRELAAAHVTRNDWAQFVDYLAEDYAGINWRAVAASQATESYGRTVAMIDRQQERCNNEQVRTLMRNLFALLSERSHGVDTEAMRLSNDTRTYARWLDRWAPPHEILIRALGGERYKATPEQERAKMDELWAQDVRYFGEQRILDVAERVRIAPKTERGNIVLSDLQALGCQSQAPPRCFWEILTTKR
jgi:hypothetical protein